MRPQNRFFVVRGGDRDRYRKKKKNKGNGVYSGKKEVLGGVRWEIIKKVRKNVILIKKCV